MSDENRLPGNFRANMRNAATASDAVRIALLHLNPCWNVLYENFLGDALPAKWVDPIQNTCATATIAGGQLTLTTGTSDNANAGWGPGLNWRGDWGAYYQVRWSITPITTAKFEVGWTDATGDAGAVNAKATPTATADDFAVLVFDTDDNTQLDLISEIDNGGPAVTAENVHTVVAGTDIEAAFTVQNDVVKVEIGSSFSNMLVISPGACLTDADIQGGDNITPWIFAQARAVCASEVLTACYMFAAGPNS